jgi:hypothetical protein
MALEKLLKEANELGIQSVFADGLPSETLLKDSIKAEKEFRKQYGETVEKDRAAYIEQGRKNN